MPIPAALRKISAFLMLAASPTAGLVLLAGCDAPPTRDSLGRVLYDIPETPETEHPYELKQLSAGMDAGESSILTP